MITKEQLANNLRVLKNKIPLKPKVYTTEHPKTIGEALKIYCNQRSVHGMQSCTAKLNEENWPLPLWFNPNNVKVGFWNKIYYRKQYNSWEKDKRFKKLRDFDFFWVPLLVNFFFKISYDNILMDAFDVNTKYAFQKVKSNPLLVNKGNILDSFIKSYKVKNWVACISSIFPLLDFVARKLLTTRNLGVDISRICKLFSQNGFSLETANHLMPHFTFVSSHKPGEPFLDEKREEWFSKMIETDFGLIGPALSSFIVFANLYYGYYKEDQEDLSIMNRHAILHGSISQFDTKENAVKLFTFLYLFLELEPVFKILFEAEITS